LVDDHPIMLEGMTESLSRLLDCQIVAKAACAGEALAAALRCRPDIVVLDLSIKGNAFETISNIVAACPGTRVVVFTGQAGVDSALKTLESGASGFVSKNSTAEELSRALRLVLAGETYITQGLAARVIAALRDSSLRKRAADAIRFSVREEQIVQLLLKGKTNKEIARQLAISEKTVKHYMSVLMQKLNARNRIEVVLAAQCRLGAENPEDLRLASNPRQRLLAEPG